MSEPYPYNPSPEEDTQAEAQLQRFADNLKLLAAELDLEVMFPDDPTRIYLLFPERNPGTRELQTKINRRLHELESQDGYIQTV